MTSAVHPAAFITAPLLYGMGVVVSTVIGVAPSFLIMKVSDNIAHNQPIRKIKDIFNNNKKIQDIISEGRRQESTCEKIMRGIGRGFQAFGIAAGMVAGMEAGDAYGKEMAIMGTFMDNRCSASFNTSPIHHHGLIKLTISLITTTIGTGLVYLSNRSVRQYLSLPEIQAKIIDIKKLDKQEELIRRTITLTTAFEQL